MANSIYCTLSQNVSLKISKKRTFKKPIEKDRVKMTSENRDDIKEKDISLEPKQKINSRAENWASRISEEGLKPDVLESQDYN